MLVFRVALGATLNSDPNSDAMVDFVSLVPFVSSVRDAAGAGVGRCFYRLAQNALLVQDCSALICSCHLIQGPTFDSRARLVRATWRIWWIRLRLPLGRQCSPVPHGKKVLHDGWLL